MSRNVWMDITDGQIGQLEEHWAQHRSEILEALDKLELSGHSVLDVGCGTGQFFDYLSQRYFLYTGMDSSPKMLKKAMDLHPAQGCNARLLFTPGNLFELEADRRERARAECAFCFSLLIHLDMEEIPTALNNLAAAAMEYIVFNVYQTTTPTIQVPNISMGSSLLFINMEDVKKLLMGLPFNNSWRFVRVGKAKKYKDIEYEHWIYKITKLPRNPPEMRGTLS
jgi:SAM-dependent methyltransferase